MQGISISLLFNLPTHAVVAERSKAGDSSTGRVPRSGSSSSPCQPLNSEPPKARARAAAWSRRARAAQCLLCCRRLEEVLAARPGCPTWTPGSRGKAARRLRVRRPGGFWPIIWPTNVSGASRSESASGSARQPAARRAHAAHASQPGSAPQIGCLPAPARLRLQWKGMGGALSKPVERLLAASTVKHRY